MLTLYRRHLRACPHRLKAREYKRCKCPIWVGGTHFGMEVRKSLDTTAWEEAEHRLDVMKKRPHSHSSGLKPCKRRLMFFFAMHAGQKLSVDTLRKKRNVVGALETLR